MFEVIPAVDIQRGKAVRLVEGRAEDETIYFDDPLEAAEKWALAGAAWLHAHGEVLGQTPDGVETQYEVRLAERDYERFLQR